MKYPSHSQASRLGHHIRKACSITWHYVSQPIGHEKSLLRLNPLRFAQAQFLEDCLQLECRAVPHQQSQVPPDTTEE